MTTTKRPLALLILDGWGYRENPQDNAIFHANTPVLDKLTATYANSLISGSGLDVGLPDGQMGNSEVGHLNLGAGRIVYQELQRINVAIKTGEFASNPTLIQSIQYAKENQKPLHLIGLVSDGGVHAHTQHLKALEQCIYQ